MTVHEPQGAHDRARPNHVDALAAENARLREIALRDDLTGLANRRAFIARLDEEIARARRYGSSFSVLLLDLDGLKDINDTFGHPAGDAALRHFGAQLARAARAGDLVARVAGDEFSVIAVHGDPEESAGFATRFAEVAAHVDFADPASGRGIVLSAATGAATFDPSIPTARDLISLADQQLNAAKRQMSELEPARAAGKFVPRGRRSAAEEVRALLAMARDVAGASDPEEMLRRAASEAARLVDVEIALAGLVGADGRVQYREVWADGAWTPWSRSFGPGERLTGSVLADGQGRIVNDGSGTVPGSGEPLLSPALAVPIHAADGAVMGVLVLASRRSGRPFIAHDLTIAQAFADLAATVVERARALAASEAARTYLRTVIDMVNDAILVADPRTVRIVDANPTAERLLGYTTDVLRGMHAAELVQVEDWPLVRAMGGRVVSGASTHERGVIRQRRQDGSSVTVELSLSRMDAPGGPLVIGVAYDLSERLRAEDELRRSRDHLRNLMDNASDAILVVDPALNAIIDANNAALEMTGYTREELHTLTSARLRAPGSDAGPTMSELALAAGGRPVQVRRRYRRRDGSTYPVEGSAALVDSPMGRVVLIILRDVSEREAAEARNAALLAALQDSAAQLRRLQGVAADITGDLDLDALLERITGAAADALGSHHNALMLLDEEAGELVTVATAGLPAKYAAERRRVPVGPNARTSGRAAHFRSVVITEDVRLDPTWAAHRQNAEAAGLYAVWAVPLIGRQGRLLGTFTSYRPRPGRPTDEQIELAKMYAAYAAVAIENAHAYADANARRRRAEALLRRRRPRARRGGPQRSP